MVANSRLGQFPSIGVVTIMVQLVLLSVKILSPPLSQILDTSRQIARNEEMNVIERFQRIHFYQWILFRKTNFALVRRFVRLLANRRLGSM